MIFWYLLTLYIGVPLFLSGFLDPAPGVFRGSLRDASEYECVLLTGESARKRLLEDNRDGYARAEIFNEDLFDCRSRVLSVADRPARVEAMLSKISLMMPELVNAARLTAPPNTVWRVEVIHPDLEVAEKIAVAAKTNLVELREKVLDQSPEPTAIGIQRFQQAKIEDGLPLLCREFAPGMTNQEKLLGIFQLNPAETQFHAGLCSNTGEWQWLL